jgi:hypothetical protein
VRVASIHSPPPTAAWEDMSGADDGADDDGADHDGSDDGGS